MSFSPFSYYFLSFKPIYLPRHPISDTQIKNMNFVHIFLLMTATEYLANPEKRLHSVYLHIIISTVSDFFNVTFNQLMVELYTPTKNIPAYQIRYYILYYLFENHENRNSYICKEEK
jgi:hypothetical protein